MHQQGTIAYEKPGPRKPVHALMPAEKDAVLAFAGREDTVDYSFQLLALKGTEALSVLPVSLKCSVDSARERTW